jgi:CRISPR-associated endonuclease/helicase Cas3
MNNFKIWAKTAKPDKRCVSLVEHTNDVLETYEKIWALFKRKAHFDDNTVNEVYRATKVAIACHDLGKVLPSFQLFTLKNKEYPLNYPIASMPHSFLSAMLVDIDALCKEVGSLCKFVLSSVAYHHWRERFFELVAYRSQDIVDVCTAFMAGDGRLARQVEENLCKEMKGLRGLDICNLIRFNDDMAKGLMRDATFMKYVVPPYHFYFLPKLAGFPEEEKRKWIIISGLLQRSDHFASYIEEEGEDGEIQPEIEPAGFPKTEQKAREKIFGSACETSHINFWQQDEIKKCKDKNVILVAPTGYGKTEFAFLWGCDDKFFYTLPLRAAVNQIFERAKDYFDDQKTGLLHSDADVFLLKDGAEEQSSMMAYELARQLAYPVLVATGDQFFPYALRPPGYEKIYATFSYSRLVVDEVQAYDPRACAIIVKFIEDVVRLGGKFLLMTATLPEFARKEINKILGQDALEELNLYSKNEDSLKEVQKHMVKLEVIENESKDGKHDFTLPSEVLRKILATAKEGGGRRVLVIVNTVEQAVKVFDALTKLTKDSEFTYLKDRIWLLHSRFTLEDRRKKEEAVGEEFKNPKTEQAEGGKVLVSTQVVEASLNIDADVMFTEVAPLDALVQRMGRVLRRYGPGNPPPGKPEQPNIFVWIFRHGLQSGRNTVYDDELVLLTLKVLTEMGAYKDSSSINADEIKQWLEDKRKNRGNGADFWIFSALEEILGSSTGKSSKKRASSKSRVVDGEAVHERQLMVLCSEFDKFVLVKTLYESLPDDRGYKRKFLETKQILDAGYMAEHKDEAHRIFREIATLPVIPKGKADEFVDSAVAFFANSARKTYTHFKRDVLCKFVLHIRAHELRGTGHMRVTDLPKVVDFLGSEEDKKRLARWCKDLWVVDGDYEETKGLIGEKGGTTSSRNVW